MKRRMIGQPNDAEDAIEQIVDAIIGHDLDNVDDTNNIVDDDDAVIAGLPIDVDDAVISYGVSGLPPPTYTRDSQAPSPWVQLASCLHELDDLAVRDVTGDLNIRKIRRDLDDLVSILATESIAELVASGEARSSPRIRAWQDAQVILSDPMSSLGQIVEMAQWALGHSAGPRR